MDSGVLGSLFRRRWSIADLMKVDEGRQAKAMQCIVNHVDTYHELEKENILGKFRKYFSRNKTQLPIYYVVFKFSVVSDSGTPHYVYIRTQADINGSEFTRNRVQIYCDCKDFMYRSAWTLNQHEALYTNSEIKTALGPAITNAPKDTTKKTVLCKHSFAALRYLQMNYSTLMRNL